MKLRLYQTPLGIVMARNLRDCRTLLVHHGEPEDVEIKIFARERGLIFSAAGMLDDVCEAIPNLDMMGPEERRRAIVKALNLPRDDGPLFTVQGSASDADRDQNV